MTSGRAAILAILAAFAPATPAAAQDASAVREIAGSVRAEVPAIGRLFGWSGSIEVVSSGQFDATPTAIAIDEDEAARLLQPLPRDSWRDALRFLVAHEVWHFVQFKTTSVDVRSAPLEERRLFECEADAAAGYYLVATLDLQHLEDPTLAVSIAALATHLGLTQMNVLDHPEEQQRHSAAQLGMVAGLRTAIAKLPPDAVTQAVAAQSDSISTFRDNDTLVSWSARACGEIMHFRSGAVAQIGIGHATVLFNKDPKTPVVSFSIPYLNRGDRATRVSVSVQSVSVPRHGDVPWTVVRRTAGLNRTFELQPGGSFLVEGVLPWYADEKLMPLLLYSPDTTWSLISAEFTPTAAISSDPVAQHLASEDVEMALALQQLANDAANRFANSRIVPGQISGHTEIFNCAVNIPGVTDAEIRWGSDGSAKVRATIYDGDSDDAARAAYTAFVAKVRGIWPLRAVRETPTTEMHTQSATIRLSRTAILVVERDDDLKRTTLTIEPQFFETDD